MPTLEELEEQEVDRNLRLTLGWKLYGAFSGKSYSRRTTADIERAILKVTDKYEIRLKQP